MSERIFGDPGTTVMGSTAAAPYQDKLLLTGVCPCASAVCLLAPHADKLLRLTALCTLHSGRPVLPRSSHLQTQAMKLCVWLPFVCSPRLFLVRYFICGLCSLVKAWCLLRAWCASYAPGHGTCSACA